MRLLGLTPLLYLQQQLCLHAVDYQDSMQHERPCTYSIHLRACALPAASAGLPAASCCLWSAASSIGLSPDGRASAAVLMRARRQSVDHDCMCAADMWLHCEDQLSEQQLDARHPAGAV